jgi:hypothetical protein
MPSEGSSSPLSTDPETFPAAVADSQTARRLLRWLWLPILMSVALLAFGILTEFLGPHAYYGVWDDAYMFVRYADNLHRYGKIAWNPGGEPTYGLTSLLFLIVVAPIRRLVPHNPMLTAVLSSLLCGLAFLSLLPLLLHRFLKAGAIVKRAAILLVFASLASATPDIVRHCFTGMDTTFVLLYLIGYLFLSLRYENAPTRLAAIGMGLYGGIAYFIRPDLMLYTTLLPLALFVFNAGMNARRNAILILGLTLLVAGSEVAFASVYFHSPFPLPFYAKALGLYEDFDMTRYRHAAANEFFDYVMSYRFLLLVIAADLALNFREWVRQSSPIEKGLLIATALFIFYYLFCVLQIMQANQRFYYPTLPAIAFLAARSAVRLAQRLPVFLKRDLRRLPFSAGIFLILGAWVALWPMGLLLYRRAVPKLASRRLARFDVTQEYKEIYWYYWFCLDDFSKLPNGMVMATTEVGHPAGMNPDRTIIDLAGLNDRMFAHQRFSAAVLFQTYHPDLIYMPHPDYQGMLRNLTADPTFQRDYEFFPVRKLCSAQMDVALLRGSPYYEAMRRIVEVGIRKQRGQNPAARLHTEDSQ